MAPWNTGSVPPLPWIYHQRAAFKTTSGFVGGCSVASACVIDRISSGTSSGSTPADWLFATSTGIASIETSFECYCWLTEITISENCLYRALDLFRGHEKRS